MRLRSVMSPRLIGSKSGRKPAEGIASMSLLRPMFLRFACALPRQPCLACHGGRQGLADAPRAFPQAVMVMVWKAETAIAESIRIVGREQSFADAQHDLVARQLVAQPLHIDAVRDPEPEMERALGQPEVE